MKTKALLHAWTVTKVNNEYYLPYTHYVYLQEIVTYYDEVLLLSPCKNLKEGEDLTAVPLKEFSNLSIYELPQTGGGYISYLKYFKHYVKAYKSITDITTYYARYPIPFGWLQKIYGKEARRIIHYVGDPIDAAKNNPNFSTLKKLTLINGFRLENALYNWADKSADVYTNGHHIAERLAKKNIKAQALISSTLIDSDFHFEEKQVDFKNLKFVYLGNLRTAKGVETVLRAYNSYNKKYESGSFKLIGSGEFSDNLKEIVSKEKIFNVEFLGRIDNRELINKILRESDVFIFGSLSEGSPRVILEAMANGLCVVSTPVGSLPHIFKDKESILFADFNDPESFFERIEEIVNKQVDYSKIRGTSHKMVKQFTIKNFIKQIFDESKNEN